MKHTREMKLAQKIRTLRSEEYNELKERLKEIYEQNVPDTGYSTVADLAIAVGKKYLPEDEDWEFFGHVAENYTYNDFVKYTVELVRMLRLATNKFIDAAVDYEMPGHREVTKDVKKDKYWAAEVQNELDYKELMIKGRIDSNYMSPIYAKLNDIVYTEFLFILAQSIRDIVSYFFLKDIDLEFNMVFQDVLDAIKEKGGRELSNDEDEIIDCCTILID